MRGGQIFFQVGGVIHITWTDFPSFTELGSQAVVEASELEFAHVILEALIHREANHNGAGWIVELGLRSQRGGDIAFASVEFLNVFQVVVNSYYIGGLAGLPADHLLQFVGGERVIAGPLHALQFVLLSRRDGEGDVDDRHMTRALLAFIGRQSHDFRLGRAEDSLQISARLIDRKELSLHQCIQRGPRIFAFSQSLRSGLQRR